MQTLNGTERDKIEELMVRHGLKDLPLKDANKDKAVQDIIFGEVIVTRTTALDSIFRGLNVIGVGNLLRAKPRVVKDVTWGTNQSEGRKDNRMGREQ